MAVPENGTYRSEDGNFSLQIAAANAANGQISGTYEASYSPEGPLAVTNGIVAHFSWVFNDG
jgi:uncharacterized lipoprotein YajG